MRRSGLVLSFLRVGLAGTGVAAIAYQAGTLQAMGVFRAGNFFSFFTIQANIVGVLVLAGTALTRQDRRGVIFDAARTGVTLYMAITGVVFAVLLSGLQESLDTHIEWVNFVVHTLMPIVLAADWLIDPPQHRSGRRLAALWLLYPAAWLAYTLIRGASVHWYPYPFVDAAQHGYGRVFLNAAVLLVCFAAAAIAFAAAGNLRAWRPRTT